MDDEDEVTYAFTELQDALAKAFHADLLSVRDGYEDYSVEYLAFTTDGKIVIKKEEAQSKEED